MRKQCVFVVKLKPSANHHSKDEVLNECGSLPFDLYTAFVGIAVCTQCCVLDQLFWLWLHCRINWVTQRIVWQGPSCFQMPSMFTLYFNNLSLITAQLGSIYLRLSECTSPGASHMWYLNSVSQGTKLGELFGSITKNIHSQYSSINWDQQHLSCWFK